MLKKIYTLLKKIIVGALLLYGFNLLAAPLNVLVPINIITVTVVTFLGMPGLCCLILMRLFVF